MRSLAIPLAMLILALAAGPVSADRLYHTERLALVPVDGAPGSGMVVNIHPDGPNIFARERYALGHADGDTAHQVWLRIFSDDLACASPLTLAIPTAVLQTNGEGNGTAQFVLTPGDVPGFLRNRTFSIDWQVTDGGVLRYATACSVVTLD